MLHRMSRPSRCRRHARWLRRSAVVVGGGLLVASVVMGTPAGAVSDTTSGYWSTVPVGPGVPSKGMWVAADPAGPVAIAALRLTLGDGESAPVILSLKLDRQMPDAAASIFACPTTGAWQPAEAGAMSAAPKYDCSKARVVGVPSSDGTRLVFDASPLATTMGLDVALVPAPASNPL